ncbi:MAG: hypothetical protein ACP5L3_04355 [Caldisericum sp.]|jgi:20S proteasome alpha/beta subunit|uniref:hypothetical protein n=2 Tax=Caldisericum sp. TaxID=2499687 RepID=UPI003D107485
MSLIVSIKVGKNIIIAADTRVHFPKTGYYSDNAKKIFIFEGKIAIGWIGDQDFSLKTIENVPSNEFFTMLGTDLRDILYLSNLKPFIDNSDKAIKSLIFVFKETSKHFVNVSPEINVYVLSKNGTVSLSEKVIKSLEVEVFKTSLVNKTS